MHKKRIKTIIKNKMKNNLGILVALMLSLASANGYTQNLLNGPQKIAIDIKRNRLLVSNANSLDIC